MRQYFFLIPLFFLSIVFFSPLVLHNKVPIAADTIVGLYNPYRDFFAKDYPNGIPFKNFLITDPVRQLFPWRKMSIEAYRRFDAPTWNPYNAAGMPLLANFQSAGFYPLNLLYLFMPFSLGWSVQVFLQVLLAGIFMFLYLRWMKLAFAACFLGAVTFSFSGTVIAWLEWNTVIQTVLWLPLILYAKERFLKHRRFAWILLSIFAETSLILAGHVQTAFYSLMVVNVYLFIRVLQILRGQGKARTFVQFLKIYKPFFIAGSVVTLLTAAQWVPTLQLIFNSARNIDQAVWQKEGWFLPWQNLVQFIAPDFFGNPTTLNYFGVWNYAEFVGYVGIVPLLMSIFALLFRRDRKTVFFGTLFFITMVFALPTFVAKLPYIFFLPFLSSSQPTRLLIIADFSLSILAALGLDLFIRMERRKIIFPYAILGSLFLLLLLISTFAYRSFGMTTEQAAVAQNNLKLPLILFAMSITVVSLFFFIRRDSFQKVFISFFLILAIADLLRFGWKFTPFTPDQYLYPTTKAISFLKKDNSYFRLMTTDDRILPPNFTSIYHIASADVYDPLYLQRFGEFISASERNEPNIDPPFGFNRIVVPHNVRSPLINLLNVKYILSFQDISSPQFQKVFSEGTTQVFENRQVLPRVFFADLVIPATDKHDAMKKLYAHANDLLHVGVVEDFHRNKTFFDQTGSIASILSYEPERVVINVSTKREGFLVFLDTNYPSWRATIQAGGNSSITKIYQTDFLFRGVVVPKGEHMIVFESSLL